MGLTPIKISGQKQAFLVSDEYGNPRGTVSQVARDAVWLAYAGIGNEASLVGKGNRRAEAIALIVSR